MIPVVDFFEEAKKYGVIAMTGEGERMDALVPPGTGGVPKDFDPDALPHAMFPNQWDKATADRFLKDLKPIIDANNAVEFVGHPDYWLIMAARYMMKDKDFIIGLPRDNKHLHSGRYTIGDTPAPGQPVGFSVRCDGDDVMLTITELVKDFDYPSERIIAPAIPAGKNIYIRMDGQRLFHYIPVVVTYGDDARAMFMDYAGDCRCCVSHLPGLEIGDTVESPYKDIPYHISVVG